MGPELRKVADTIMSDLGMGEDQDKIDALDISRRLAGRRGSQAVDSAVIIAALLLSAQPARCERR